MRAHLRRDGTRTATILRTLAAAPGGEVYTTDLIPFTEKPWRWDDPAVVRQRALARAGNILRELEAGGLTERAGKSTDTGWQRCPIHRWRITADGRDLIAWWDQAPQREAVHAELAAARVSAAQARRDALENARQSYGPGTPRARRQEVAYEMRKAGCTLREIAGVFGVVPECIRLDLLNQPYVPRRPSQHSRVTMGRRGRWPNWVHALDDTPLAGLARVTLTEW